MKSRPASEPSPSDADLTLAIERFIAAQDTTSRLQTLVAVVSAARLNADDESGHAAEHFLDAIERDGELRDRFGQALAKFLADTDATGLVGCAGIPGTRGFFAEMSERLFAKFLPSPRNQSDLGELFGQLYGSEAEVERLRNTPLDLAHRLVQFFHSVTPDGAWDGLRLAFGDGFRLLVSRVRAEGLSSGLRTRTSAGPVTASPYYRLEEVGERLVGRWLAGDDFEDALTEFQRVSGECRKESRAILAHLDATGVRVDVVFSLEVIERCLTRTALMTEFMASPEGPLRSKAIQKLLVRLVHFAARDRSVGDLIFWNLYLLGRKIVDRTADTGEHYIAKNRREYWNIWTAAAGGGLLTVFTAMNKAAIHSWHLPPLPEGLLFGFNYAISFLVLQHLGLILATKQPAMTAAHFASIIRESEGADREERIADNAARLVSSQLAAAFGNVLAIGVCMLGVGWLWEALTGAPFFDAESAAETLRSMNPVGSGTAFYAALTGVVLWFASVVGGWFDNWCVCHRIAEGIAQRPARTSIDAERWQWLGRMVERHAAGWGTNISLGFMLGLMPMVGRIAGLPLDVRHVTLNTGMVSLAGVGIMDEPGALRWLLLAGCGIATMFVLNLSVSFACSLASAAKAYKLSGPELWGLLRGIGRRLVRRPGQFVFGPREDGSNLL
jgi:site-specific recombinase